MFKFYKYLVNILRKVFWSLIFPIKQQMNSLENMFCMKQKKKEQEKVSQEGTALGFFPYLQILRWLLMMPHGWYDLLKLLHLNLFYLERQLYCQLILKNNNNNNAFVKDVTKESYNVLHQQL